MRAVITLVAALLVGAIVSGQPARAPLRMSLVPVFESKSTFQGISPVIVEIENDGPNAAGVIRVESDIFAMSYPVELPSGSRKSVTTYPIIDWGTTTFTLATNRGMIQSDLPFQGSTQSPMRASLIGDSPWILPNSDAGLQSGFARVENAPDRADGYGSNALIILGEGAERLTDRQIAALRSWVMTGGSVAFAGGTNLPVVQDRRWADLLPARDIRTVVMPARTAYPNRQLEGDVTVMTGEPDPRAEDLNLGFGVATWARPFGFGRVILLPFNPTATPFRQSPSLGRLLFTVTDRRQAQPSAVSLALSAQRSGAVGTSLPPPIIASGGSTAAAVSAMAQDPFAMSLPSVWTIVWILGTYTLVAIPLSFLLLRKLGRIDLAWFTTPLLSLIFAGVLFSTARALYAAQSSSITSGTLVAVSGQRQAVFRGLTQMFVPQAGSYDLKLSGVESVGSLSDDSDAMRGTFASLGLIDDGEIRAPAVRATNLAFMNLSYRQNIDLGGEIMLRKIGPDEVEVINRTQLTLLSVSVRMGRKSGILPPLAPGESAQSRVDIRPGYDSMSDRVLRQGDTLINGRVTGIRPGPQLGEPQPNREEILLYYFIPRPIR
jgi:hypothetical protein